jgi:MFS family permease
MRCRQPKEPETTAMRIMKSVAAIAAGLGFMAATVTVGTLLASALLGGGEPADGKPSATALVVYLLLNLVICGIGAILGGWLAARIATFAPYGHAAVMAAIVAVLSITTATGASAPGHPEWYPSALGLVAILGVLLGGKLRAAAASTGPVVA